MKFIVQDTFSIKKVLIFGGFGLCRFQHKVGMNSFPMRMNVISYGTNSFPWGMYSFRSKIPIVYNRWGGWVLVPVPSTPTEAELFSSPWYIAINTPQIGNIINFRGKNLFS